MVKELKAKEEIVFNSIKEKVSPFSKVTRGDLRKNDWMSIKKQSQKKH